MISYLPAILLNKSHINYRIMRETLAYVAKNS